MDQTCGPERKVRLRPLTSNEQDFELLARWLSQPEIRHFYPENPDIVHLCHKFGSRTAPDSRVRPFVIQYQEIPVGYAQYYVLTSDESMAYGLPLEELWGGFDLFIGDINQWGKGVGLKTCHWLMDALCQQKVVGVAIDCDATNVRALHLYKKVGFSVRKTIRPRETDRVQTLLTWSLGAECGDGELR